MAYNWRPSGIARDIWPLGELRETVLNAPSQQVLDLPFYNDLPRDYFDLLRVRIAMRERAKDDREFRKSLWDIWAADICAFANTAVYVFEPRPPAGPVAMPLMIWDDQSDVLTWMDEVFGRRGFICEKSRGIGVTWDMAINFYHKWLTQPGCILGLSTKDEDTLDSEDTESLIGKMVFMHKHMPAWARLDGAGRDIMHRTLQNHTARNRLNGSVWIGYAPTDAKPRSLRFTAFGHDEYAEYPRKAEEGHASIQGTTHCVYFISTRHSRDTAFDAMCRDEKTPCLRVKTYWYNNPERWRGAYRTYKGRVEIIDHDYEFPPGYEFQHDKDNLIRSPWVDSEIARALDKDAVYRDLYGPDTDSGRLLFRDTCRAVVSATTKPPIAAYELDGDQLIPVRDGSIKVFEEIEAGKAGPFTAGCDLAFGRGRHYSSLEMVDLTTGKQVLDAASNDLNPTEWGYLCWVVLKWANGKHGDGHTYLSFENNGDAGSQFCDELLRLGYGNIEKNEKKQKIRRNDAPEYYGVTSRDGGLVYMAAMETAILDGTAVVQSPWCAAEMQCFEKDEEKGRPHYPKNAPAGGHGDRVQGLAIALHAARRRWIKAQSKTEAGENRDRSGLPSIADLIAKKKTRKVWRPWLKSGKLELV